MQENRKNIAMKSFCNPHRHYLSQTKLASYSISLLVSSFCLSSLMKVKLSSCAANCSLSLCFCFFKMTLIYLILSLLNVIKRTVMNKLWHNSTTLSLWRVLDVL